MKRHTHTAGTGLFAIGIAALFLAGFLLLVVFGAKTYRGTVERQRENGQLRAQLSYFSTIVKAGDAAGAVEVQQSAYGPVFVVTDEVGYALRVYRWEGKLVEDYAAAGTELRPESANVIGETATFTVEEDGGLLRIRTDEGQAVLRLRSK
jgi:hypothetical protein